MTWPVSHCSNSILIWADQRSSRVHFLLAAVISDLVRDAARIPGAHWRGFDGSRERQLVHAFPKPFAKQRTAVSQQMLLVVTEVGGGKIKATVREQCKQPSPRRAPLRARSVNLCYYIQQRGLSTAQKALQRHAPNQVAQEQTLVVRLRMVAVKQWDII